MRSYLLNDHEDTTAFVLLTDPERERPSDEGGDASEDVNDNGSSYEDEANQEDEPEPVSIYTCRVINQINSGTVTLFFISRHLHQ